MLGATSDTLDKCGLWPLHSYEIWIQTFNNHKILILKPMEYIMKSSWKVLSLSLIQRDYRDVIFESIGFVKKIP